MYIGGNIQHCSNKITGNYIIVNVVTQNFHLKYRNAKQQTASDKMWNHMYTQLTKTYSQFKK